jgi:hypothetical protein
MSGSDQDGLKDLELENDVVETQGTVRYKQAANTQDPDDLDDLEDELFEEIVPVETNNNVAQIVSLEKTGDIAEDYWEDDDSDEELDEADSGTPANGEEAPVLVRHKLAVRKKVDETDLEVIKQTGGTVRHKLGRTEAEKPRTNLVVKLLEKNPLGMTLPEMAGGVRKQKRIKTLRPMLMQAIKEGLIMPISQRAGHTVYKLVKNMGPR